MTLYNLRSDGTITKWDSDGNIQAQYSVSEDGCTCPAGHRHTCRHRQMLPDLLPIADTHWFLDWDGGKVITDFNGTLKQWIDDLIIPASVDLPAEQDTIPEWHCPKCGAQADERFDCCEVYLKTTLPVSSWRRI